MHSARSTMLVIQSLHRIFLNMPSALAAGAKGTLADPEAHSFKVPAGHAKPGAPYQPKRVPPQNFEAKNFGVMTAEQSRVHKALVELKTRMEVGRRFPKRRLMCCRAK